MSRPPCPAATRTRLNPPEFWSKEAECRFTAGSQHVTEVSSEHLD
jgi:hypothetical protein